MYEKAELMLNYKKHLLESGTNTTYHYRTRDKQLLLLVSSEKQERNWKKNKRLIFALQDFNIMVSKNWNLIIKNRKKSRI